MKRRRFLTAPVGSGIVLFAGCVEDDADEDAEGDDSGDDETTETEDEDEETEAETEGDEEDDETEDESETGEESDDGTEEEADNEDDKEEEETQQEEETEEESDGEETEAETENGEDDEEGGAQIVTPDGTAPANQPLEIRIDTDLSSGTRIEIEAVSLRGEDPPFFERRLTEVSDGSAQTTIKMDIPSGIKGEITIRVDGTGEVIARTTFEFS